MVIPHTQDEYKSPATTESWDYDASMATPPVPWWARTPRLIVLLPICVAAVMLYRRVLVPYLDGRGVSGSQFYIWFFVVLGIVALIGLPIEHMLRKKYGLTSRRGIKERIAAARQALRR